MTGEVEGEFGIEGSDASRVFGERELSEFRREAAEKLMLQHERTLRRTARRYSICADDAEDAYQRALEILLTKAPPIEGDALIRWMQTVTKREALGVRRQRVRLVGSIPPAVDEPETYDPFESVASETPEPDEKVARAERVHRSSEALRALKPQEVRALILKAEGYSYREIQEITGWTYTKVNRCMAEGRKRFLGAFTEIEAGERCDLWEGDLSRIADGEAESGDLVEARVHLRTCAVCRARLREYRRVPGRVFGLGLPLPLLAAVDWIDAKGLGLVDRLRSLSSQLSRTADSFGDRAITLASTGGSRGTGSIALAKLLAVCGMAAAGSAACAISGVVPEPISSEARPVAPAAVSSALDPVHPVVSESVSQADSVQPIESVPSPPDPGQQSSMQFSFEAPAPSPPRAPVGATVEAPPTSQPQFGFEK